MHSHPKLSSVTVWRVEAMKTGGMRACKQGSVYTVTVVCTVLLIYPGCSINSAVSASCSTLSSKVSTPTVVVYAQLDIDVMDYLSLI